MRDEREAVELGMRIFVLAAFLENPEHGVRTYELEEEYKKRLNVPGFTDEMVGQWNSACTVVDGYVATGGLNNFGGTGLLSIEEIREKRVRS